MLSSQCTNSFSFFEATFADHFLVVNYTLQSCFNFKIFSLVLIENGRLVGLLFNSVHCDKNSFYTL